MILLLSLFAALVSPAQRPAAPTRDVVAEVRGRLEAYEGRKQENPKELAEIARLVMAASETSTTFAVWSEACASAFATDPGACQQRLRDTLGRGAAPLAQRAKAGVILIGAGAADAADLLYGVVKDLGAKDLASIAPELASLPPARAVPLLARALSFESASARSAACRALGTIDTGESRQALRDAVAAIPPGTPEWLACTVARARLNEPDATWKLQGISGHMTGEDLIDAGDAMVAIGNPEGGLYAIQKASRLGTRPQQLAAARRLATLEPEAARTFVDANLADKDAAIRAGVLGIEPLLKRTPAAAVRARLADPDELARLRAAVAVLDWASRHK